LIAGFTVLAQSTFKLNGDMGMLTAITILIALLIDFLFLPPLLMLVDKSDAKKNSQNDDTIENEDSAELPVAQSN